jgi:sortase A
VITLPGAAAAGSDGIILPPAASAPSHSSNSGYSNKFTLPDGLYYADKSIGTLSIPKLKVTAKVYEEESLENLAKGIGHFKFTSCWEGNVGFAAHNRGIAAYFGQIHTLKAGDKIVYTTKLGTLTYSVYYVGQIKETDMSRLGRTDENIVTLVTCVRDVPSMRWCVQARMIG